MITRDRAWSCTHHIELDLGATGINRQQQRESTRVEIGATPHANSVMHKRGPFIHTPRLHHMTDPFRRQQIDSLTSRALTITSAGGSRAARRVERAGAEHAGGEAGGGRGEERAEVLRV